MPFPETPPARRTRTVAFCLAIGLVLALLGARLFYLQIVQGARYAEQARNNMIRSSPLPAVRGRIFDRRGVLLAGNRVSLNLALEAGLPV